jgi:murein DD-endopeptidase MepM/ murein hydrolase activator NlpD
VNTGALSLSSVPVSSSISVSSIPGASGQSISQAGNLSRTSSPSGTNSSIATAADIFKIGIADFDLADRVSGKAAYALTGSTKNRKFKPENCDKKLGSGSKDGDCANIEINNSITLQGLATQAINPNADGVVDGMQLVHKKQIVKGGHGALASINGGNEPTGWKPWGMKPPVKLVLAKINQAETSADLELYFQVCKKFLGCTPHFLGPVPAPPPFSPVKDKGPIIITTVNKPPPIPPQFAGIGGNCSSAGANGLPAPSSNPNAPVSQQNLKRYLERIAAGESAGGTNLGPNYLGAYGKYQFIPSTRAAILAKYGYDAWNPAQWDNAAISLIKDVGGQNLLDTIAAGNFSGADAALNRTWTSLPGGAEQSPLWNSQANLIAYGPVAGGLNTLPSTSGGVGSGQQQTLIASAAGGCGAPIPCPPGQKCVLLNPNPKGIIPGYGGMYGAPRPGRIHAGVDLQSPKGYQNWQRGPGENIMAAADGVVSEHVPVGGACGGIVAIKHSNLGLETRYLHMVQTFVTQGQQIMRGQYVGVEGNETPDRCGSTGTHLHYEIYAGGGTTDPTKVPHEPALPTAPGV